MSGARERMIEAAERIGAEQGLSAMSLREVQTAAEQRNKSAAAYHFGSRDGLVEAVVTTRMAPINAHRADLLAAMESPDLRSLVEALVVPLATATSPAGSHWARFLFQGWADPALQAVVRGSFAASSYRTLRSMLADALDHLPPERRARRIDQATGVVVMTLAASERGAAEGEPTPDPDEQAADLVEVCCALLRAPAAPSPAAPSPARATRPRSTGSTEDPPASSA